MAVQRVAKAKKAMKAAQNPEFKNYWRKVADTLSKHIDD
jgi:hypothetical protein